MQTEVGVSVGNMVDVVYDELVRRGDGGMRVSMGSLEKWVLDSLDEALKIWTELGIFSWGGAGQAWVKGMDGVRMDLVVEESVADEEEEEETEENTDEEVESGGS